MERRAFLKAGTALSIGGLGLRTRAAAAAGNTVRRDVSALQANSPEIMLYRRAYELMSDAKQFPSTDPRNWTRQAQIHNDFCPHGNWWFLPWHRAYLWHFEQVCRDVLQNAEFAIPYWDWTTKPQIPAPFWERPLLHTRDADANTQMRPEFVGRTTLDTILGAPSVTTFFSGGTQSDNQREPSLQGQLESGPHNNVHGDTGGDMGTFMSPLDPIFWLHHANIDRIWESWARATGNRTPSGDLWKNHALRTFYDPVKKTNVSPATSEVLTAANWGAVYDRYEVVPQSAARAAAAFQTAALSLAAIRTGTGLGFDGGSNLVAASAAFPAAGARLRQTVRAKIQPNNALQALLERAPFPQAAAQPAGAFLVLDGVSRPKSLTTSARVFLNCVNPSINTPVDDPSYVGSISFFGAHDEAHGQHAEASFIFDAGATMARLSQSGRYKPSDPLDVAVVAFDSRDPRKPSTQEVIKPRSVRVVAAE